MRSPRQQQDVPYSSVQREASAGEKLLSVEWPNVPLESDTFGISVCSMIRDFNMLARRRGSVTNRIARLSTTFLLLFACIFIQVFMLIQVKRFVSAKAVHDVRIAYDVFEHHTYDGHTTVFSSHPRVERRGIGGPQGRHFNRSAFHTYPQRRGPSGRLPNSVVTAHVLLQRAVHLDAHVHRRAPQVQGHIYGLRAPDGDVPQHGARPRAGGRWATNNFSALILNSMALEFILCLEDVMYVALVPRRSMIDVEKTTIKLRAGGEKESLKVLIGTLSWAVLAATWVAVYMGVPGYHNGIQQVLRAYQWDVHDVCAEWTAKRYAV
mmetsp:Transcript_6093/g.15621  ORF Transcript_6093/g.15621 Transcript_6093/m.15621 type:complete len:322 (-) Transcript_6093:354-1319(-)